VLQGQLQLQPQGSQQLQDDAAAAQQQQAAATPALNKADISRSLAGLEDRVMELEGQLKELEAPAELLTSKLAASHQHIVQVTHMALVGMAVWQRGTSCGVASLEFTHTGVRNVCAPLLGYHVMSMYTV
jgi:hypothetical protein